MTIAGITIAVGLEVVKVTRGIDLRGCLNYRLRRIKRSLLHTRVHQPKGQSQEVEPSTQGLPTISRSPEILRSGQRADIPNGTGSTTP
jgi:hypothetical protein